MLADADVTEEQAENIHERELKRISRKFIHMRYHSFLVYFVMLKRLGWVETTTETGNSSILLSPDSSRQRGGAARGFRIVVLDETLWSNPQYALYPENGRSHQSKQIGWPHRKVWKFGM